MVLKGCVFEKHAQVQVSPGGVQEQECVKQEPAVRAALSKMYRSGKNIGVLHDMKCTGAMHPLSSDVIKVPCIPLTFISESHDA